MNHDDSINNGLRRSNNATVVPAHKYPWIVSMQAVLYGYGVHICSGSIISDRAIITAGKNFKHYFFYSLD